MVPLSSVSFLEFAEVTVDEINSALLRLTDYDDDCPEKLQAAIRHSLLAPGKRLRPLLVLMAARACGFPGNQAMPIACAVEMVHTYSLIHDDLPAMDDDTLRRGRPTCHVQFDEATAILAGDALLTQAFEVVAGCDLPAEKSLACCRQLARAAGASGMVGGQVDDLDGSSAKGTIEQLERIHRRKTGAMFEVSLRLGGLVAGAAEPMLDALDTFGENLGLAFQIVDDLLDIRGDADALGKSVGKDEQQNKVTFPAIMGIDASRLHAERLIQQAQSALSVFGKNSRQLDSLALYVLDRNH